MREISGECDSSPVDVSCWEELLCEGAQEVFEKMIGVPLRRCRQEPLSQAAEFTAVVGVAGPLSGLFALRCDEKTAIGIACDMLGVDEEGARAELWDALAEVCNMVVGNFKHKTGKTGELSVLTVPTVIRGQDYQVRPLVDGSVLDCRMETADGSLQIRLDYRLS